MIFDIFRRNANASYQNLDAAAFRDAVKADKNAVILDVRTPAEVAGGKIKGAKTINYSDPGFAQAIAQLDKNKSYYVYCRSGMRSAGACKAMAKQGFTSLYNLSGGILSWSYGLS